MTSVQLHLALTHVPVILSLVGLAMFVTALFLKNPTLTRTSYILLIIAGIAAIPVYLTGEGAEESVEHLPGVSESIIERHEDFSKLALISISSTGLAALIAVLTWKWRSIARILSIIVLLLALISGGMMVQTAHLGGLIRHSELRAAEREVD